jgi:hypothetical protein
MGGLTLECVDRHVPDQNQHNSLVPERRLIRHAARSWELIVGGRIDSAGREDCLHRFRDVFANQGQLKEAEKMYQQALQGKEKA